MQSDQVPCQSVREAHKKELSSAATVYSPVRVSLSRCPRDDLCPAPLSCRQSAASTVHMYSVQTHNLYGHYNAT